MKPFLDHAVRTLTTLCRHRPDLADTLAELRDLLEDRGPALGDWGTDRLAAALSATAHSGLADAATLLRVQALDDDVDAAHLEMLVAARLDFLEELLGLVGTLGLTILARSLG